MEGDTMPHRYNVRPHLLDEAAIHKAILNSGFDAEKRSLVTEYLLEHYTVDLDLLASAFLALGESEGYLAKVA